MINVDASATMSGMYQGGSGYILPLIEGVAQDNGAAVDFTRGRNANEAEVDNYGGTGNSLFFEISEFEEIRLILICNYYSWFNRWFRLNRCL